MEGNGELPNAEDRRECTLDQLCDRDKGYVCDQVERLVQGPVNNQVDWLKDRVAFIFRSIRERGKQVEEFYIGKTYAPKNENFDPTDPDTWKKKGIQDRWRYYRERKHYNGLIVLTLVTEDMLPPNPENENGDENRSHTNQQDYAIMLEQRLLHNYKIEEYDRRIKNPTFAEGNRGDDEHPGVVYVAVKLN